MNGSNGAEPILDVKDLKTHFFTDSGDGELRSGGRKLYFGGALQIATKMA